MIDLVALRRGLAAISAVNASDARRLGNQLGRATARANAAVALLVGRARANRSRPPVLGVVRLALLGWP